MGYICDIDCKKVVLLQIGLFVPERLRDKPCQKLVPKGMMLPLRFNPVPLLVKLDKRINIKSLRIKYV